MKKLVLFFSLFTILAATTCKKVDINTNAGEGAAGLRVENATPFRIDSCFINPGTWNTGHHYGPINVNDLTSYHGFDTVYHYGYIKVKMNGKTYQLVPIDYMGETPFRAGRFTYKLTYLPGPDRLDLEFKRD